MPKPGFAAKWRPEKNSGWLSFFFCGFRDTKSKQQNCGLMHANTPNDLMIFNAALEITAPAERGAYIDQACGADAALRQKVISLLAAYENGDDTFDHFGRAATINVQEQNRDLERSGSI